MTIDGIDDRGYITRLDRRKMLPKMFPFFSVEFNNLPADAHRINYLQVLPNDSNQSEQNDTDSSGTLEA